MGTYFDPHPTQCGFMWFSFPLKCLTLPKTASLPSISQGRGTPDSMLPAPTGHLSCECPIRKKQHQAMAPVTNYAWKNCPPRPLESCFVGNEGRCHFGLRPGHLFAGAPSKAAALRGMYSRVVIFCVIPPESTRCYAQVGHELKAGLLSVAHHALRYAQCRMR